jgi:signal transduction histidine kinase
MKTRVHAISYFLSILTIVTIFCGLEFMTKKLIYPNDEVMDLIGDIIGALLFARFKQFFDQVTKQLFFRAPRDERAEFISNISHELQTPIAILRGNVEMLQSGRATDAERATAERVIVTTLDGMSRLIGNVLESAKLKFSKKILYEQEIAVCALLRETHEDCLLLAEDKGICLLLEIDEGAEDDISVRGSRDRLKEVLFNLISNALKHTPCGGTITLRAERVCGLRGHGVGVTGVTRITVQDSGCGIAPEELPHIFERFYRIENRPLAFAEGDVAPSAEPSHGIGLNICREIVEAHKGTIVAESAPGKGSWFIISLPLSPPARAPASRGVSAIINS